MIDTAEVVRRSTKFPTSHGGNRDRIGLKSPDIQSNAIGFGSAVVRIAGVGMMDWFTRIAPIRQKVAIVVPTMAGLIALTAIVGLIAALAGHPLFGAAIGAAIVASAALAGGAIRRAICDPYVGTMVRREGLAAGDLHRPSPIPIIRTASAG